MSRRHLALIALAVAGVTVAAASATEQQQQWARNRPRIPSSVERGIQEALTAYTAGDDHAVERWMATSQGRSSFSYVEFVLTGDSAPWSRAKAAFLLEIVAAVTNAPAPQRDGFAVSFRAPSLLKSGASSLATRLTPVGADPEEDRFELLWYQAALGMAQGIQQYWLQQDLLDIITVRFKSVMHRSLLAETRVPLARGIAAGGLCCTGRLPGEVIQIMPSADRRHPSPDLAVALFDEAAAIPALRVEALIRGAVLLHKLGRPVDALAWFERVPPHNDRTLGYMHQISYARVLDGTPRAADAAAAYRQSLTYEPTSQLAAIGLAAALLRAGQDQDAVTAAVEARKLAQEKMPTYDLAYRRGDARYVSDWLAEIRRRRR